MEHGSTAGKTIRCRAAVVRKPGEAIAIEEVMVAPPKAGEVRLRIICSSLCHTDFTYSRLQDPTAIFPRILGHESVGVVESVGEGVTDLTQGDTVIPTFLPDCTQCTDCRSKRSNLCSEFPFDLTPYLHDGTSRFTDLKGDTIYHFLFVSSFSEYTVLHSANVVKIDPTVPPNRACLLSCGVSTGVGSVWKCAQVEAGSTVAIFGLGARGLAVAEGARLFGAARIIGVDTNSEKSEIGKRFGVTDFVDSSKTGDKCISQVIKDMTGGSGVDYCFECVGSARVVEEAFASSRKGWGKTVVLGVDKPESKIKIWSLETVNQGKTLMGSGYGGLKPKTDIPVLVQRYMNKELELDKFVTHEIGFEDINKAFELMQEGKSLRCVIWMGK